MIEFRSIIEPVRSYFEDMRFVQVIAVDMDFTTEQVHCLRRDGLVGHEQRFSLAYDYLVISVGAETASLGIPGVHQHVVFLKSLTDARMIRQQLIQLLELAEAPGLEEKERRRLLQIIVVCGGPTGIEFAAELQDFVADDLTAWYPRSAAKLQVTLLEAADEILSGFNAQLREVHRKTLQEGWNSSS